VRSAHFKAQSALSLWHTDRPPKNTMSIIFKDAGELPMPVVKVEDVSFG
jgi:hypothetical protein